jgi:alpha-mannosidase
MTNAAVPGKPENTTIERNIAMIQQAIDDLRSTVQRDVIDHWLNDQGQPLELNEKRHIAWPKGERPLILKQRITLPDRLDSRRDSNFALTGMTTRLALTWWAQSATVKVDGKTVQEGDLFDHSARVVLSRSLQPGETVEIEIHLTSPGHDAGALMRSRLIFEADYEGDYAQLDPGFVADELAVVLGYIKAIEPAELATLCAIVTDWQNDGADWRNLHDRLLPYAEPLQQYQIDLLGHAHLDMAWLWPIAETWEAAERTFKSVLGLQRDFPEMVFCHTTPLLYEWLEHNRPELFQPIQVAIAAGQWEAIGGMWVEPELNLLDCESIVRHILYGQRYYQRKFGQTSRVAWLPDTFGFCAQLPQLLKQGGMDYFVTQKLRWNDTNRYPHEIFRWRSPDGSEVMSLMSAPIGEGIDPIKLSDYCWEWQQRTGDRRPLWLPGMGDHGGGPTRDMLHIARRWQTSPLFPKMEFTTAEAYLDRLESANSDTPIHTGDLYLELHRGCYTAHGDQKAYNRDGQNALYCAELWNTIAQMQLDRPYPQAKLETAWKQVLLNQFHDILPGSSINAVYQDANPAWQRAIHTAKTLTNQALQALAAQVSRPAPPSPNAVPIIVFNPLNWERSAIVRCAYPNQDNHEHPQLWQIQTHDSDNANLTAPIAAYVEPDAKAWENLWIEFPARDIPACGYRLYWLIPSGQPFEVPEPPPTETIENAYLRLEIDSASGDIRQLWDKQNQREVFSDYANQIELFQDQGQYWDAWNIDPNYEQHPLPPSQHFDVVRMESRYAQELWAVGQGGSRGYILEADCPWLIIKNQIKGDERHLLQKACFPLSFSADRTTYETAAGVIDRPTRPTTPEEKAQWEVPGLRWADMTAADGSYGVSILSDRKHGYDHSPNQIRLTLLRGSEWPDPEADKGTHHFSYGIYPHAGNWQTADTVKKAREMSQPLQAIALAPELGQTIDPTPHIGRFAAIGSFLHLGSDNLILTALKPSEDNPKTYILRCYESLGQPAELNLQGLVTAAYPIAQRVNLLEVPIGPNPEAITIAPWQITSLKLN